MKRELKTPSIKNALQVPPIVSNAEIPLAHGRGSTGNSTQAKSLTMVNNGNVTPARSTGMIGRLAAAAILVLASCFLLYSYE